MEKKSLLEELYADAGAFDVASAVSALKPILSMQRGGAEVFFTKEGKVLKADDKVLAYFLVKKLLKADGITESASASGKEVHECTDLPTGTIDPSIARLKKDGYLAGSGKNYEIPNRKVDEVVERLEKSANKKS